MKKLLLSISAVCTTLSIFAQDYYPIKRNDIYFFGILPLKVDSVKVEAQDSVYFLYKQIRKLDQNVNCAFTALGDSWLGDSIRVKPDGSCIFVNKLKTPFLLKTLAKPNEKWIAFQSTKWKAEISVSAIAKETYLGITDSVKTFVINVLKIDGSDTASFYDGTEIKLCKKSGLVKLLDFYAFGSDNEEVLQNLTYAGSQNLKDGIYNITAKEIYNYEVGDVFHTNSYYNPAANGGSITGTKYIDSIVSKKTELIQPQNQIGNAYETIRRKTTYKGKVESFEIDTLVLSYGHNDLISLPPDSKPYYDGGFWGSASLSKTSNGRIKKTIVNDLYAGSPKCLNEVIDGGGCPEEYIEGLGGGYYRCSGSGLSSRVNELVYYKKGNEEWGTPLILGTLEEEAFQSEITISPNPASSFINFDLGKISSTVRINLMDNSSKIVYSETALGFTKIDISAFKKGMYFYSISSNNNKRLTGKLIVE